MRNTIILSLALVLGAGASFAETHIPAGEVFGVWDVSGSPYYIEGSIHIPTDSMLTIEPGCSIVFTDHYKFCVDSNAVLKAIGTEDDSIIFTADDTIFDYYSGGHHGIRFYYAADGCTLSYCKIEYGHAYGDSADEYGGAIYCYRSNLTIENNTIWKNSSAGNCVGICCENASPIIIDNLITANSADGLGGAILCINNANPVIENNRIVGNECCVGGGIACWDYSNPVIKNNIIVSNLTDDGVGGGIACGNSSNSTIINNIISENWADEGGGGIFCIYSNPVISSNTIVDNSTDMSGGGIFCCNISTPVILNTIVYNNFAYEEGNDIYLSLFDYEHNGPSTLFVAYTDIDTENCYIDTGAGEIIWGNGNINADPMFEDTLFHLSAGSPCIDAGAESMYVPIWDTTIYTPNEDYEGSVRPFGAGYDIGADEYGTGAVFETKAQKPQRMNIFAYPNPFNSSVKITAPAGAGNLSRIVEIEISDLQGKVVYEIPSPLVPLPGEEGSKSPSLPPGRDGPDLSGQMREFIWTPDKSISSGIYLVKARTEDGSTASKKVIYLK